MLVTDNGCKTFLTFNVTGLHKTLVPQVFGFRTDNAKDVVTEYDSSSDEEERKTDISELDRGSMFLLGTITRFGHQVRIHTRLIS